MMVSLDMAILVLRVVIGLLFIGHGSQKLFGWFGGNGITGTANWLKSLGFNPPLFWAYTLGLAEFLGGLGLVLGLFTPVAAAAILAVMVMAIVKVHWSNGLWITNNGSEYALVNLVVVGFIALVGPGLYALDAYPDITYPMPITFYTALLVAIAGVLVALFGSQPTRPEARGA